MADNIIQTKIVLDTSGLRDGLDKAKNEGGKQSESTGKKIAEGFVKVSEAIIGIHFTIKGLHHLFNQFAESAQKLHDIRGVGDEATESFLRMKAAAGHLWDSFVLGVLKSNAVQAVLGGIASGLSKAAEWVGKLGESFDAFVKENANGIVVAIAIMAATFNVAKQVFENAVLAARAFGDVLLIVGGKIISFLGKMGGALGKLLDAVGFDKASKAVTEASEALKGFGDNLAKITAADAIASVDRMEFSVEQLGDAINGAAKAAKGAAEEIGRPINHNSGILELFGPESDIRNDTVAHDILEATNNLAKSVGDVWQTGVERIGALFTKLSDRLVDTEDAMSRSVLVGLSSVMGGFAAFGTAAEHAFGKSSLAAKIWAKAQLGLQAKTAYVDGMKSLADSQNALGDGNHGEAMLKAGAAGLYFAAAGIAGGEALGVFGSGGGGSARAASALPSSDIPAADTVKRQPTQIIFKIEGNLIDNRDYIRNELLPQMRDMVQNEDAVVVASHALVAGALGDPRP